MASHLPTNLATNLSDIAHSVAALRKKAKLSQTALGELAGLSRMPVYRLEAGQDISLRSFLAILQALKLQLAIHPAANGPLRAADLKAAFEHLHADEDAP